MLFQSPNLRVEVDSFSLATLWLDVQGQRFNILNRPVMDDLGQALTALEGARDLKGLVIRGAKETGFLAGADIGGFATIAGTAEEARALSERGQQLFGRVAALSPRLRSVALIEGPCLGGGLELALACDYRLANERSDTQMGLPEVELGLLPGWGGTQRLPRLVGLENALQIILAGKRLHAREAVRWGLVHRAVSPDEVTSNLASIALQLLAGGKAPPAARRTWRQRLLESNPVGRFLLLRGTERILRRRVPDDMPAPFEALNAIRVGLREGMEAGLRAEREAAGRLALTPACRNLVGLFLTRESARKLPAELRALAPEPVQRVGVVGAGAMGAGIAQLAAFRGCDVVVQEVNEAALGAGLLKVAALFHKAVERRLLTKEEADRRLARVQGTTAWKGFGDVDVAIEAVVEDLGVKQKVFRDLEAHTKPTAVLATNTSSLSVTPLQQGFADPGRVAGLHFFNPVHKMPLVEVVRAPSTEARSVAVLASLASALGKTPVVVKDSPGFVVNRILMPYLSEAVLLVVQKVRVDQIDKLMRRFGMPMGPLELLDQIGLDVAAHVGGTMKPAADGPLAGYAAAVGKLFQQMAGRGWLGQKSGVGFYRYRGRRRRPNPEAALVLQNADLRDTRLDVGAWLPPQPGESRDRLVLSMVNAAAACVGEGLADSPETIDLAMVLGTGWAPHRGGPLHYADVRGLDEVVRVLQGLASRLGPWFEPVAELRRRAERGEAFCPVPVIRQEA